MKKNLTLFKLMMGAGVGVFFLLLLTGNPLPALAIFMSLGYCASGKLYLVEAKKVSEELRKELT